MEALARLTRIKCVVLLESSGTDPSGSNVVLPHQSIPTIHQHLSEEVLKKDLLFNVTGMEGLSFAWVVAHRLLYFRKQRPASRNVATGRSVRLRCANEEKSTASYNSMESLYSIRHMYSMSTSI